MTGGRSVKIGGAWVKLIKPTAGKKTKAEGRYQARKAQTEPPEGLGKVSASKRKAQTEQPEGLEKVSAGKRDAEEMITTYIHTSSSCVRIISSLPNKGFTSLCLAA